MKAKANRAGFEYGAITLRHPRNADRPEFTRNAAASRALHSGFVDPPKDDRAFDQFLENACSDTERRFVILENVSSQIAGAITFSQIFLKSFRSAYLGYYLFSGFTGRNLMTDAVRAALRYGFDVVGLHRVEANVQPENIRSIALVKRCGFTREGYSRKYLKFEGEWRDHERWAMIREDWEKFGSG